MPYETWPNCTSSAGGCGRGIVTKLNGASCGCNHLIGLDRDPDGLIRCGQCGRRMMVAYSGDRGRAGRYVCSRTFQQQGTRRPCQASGALRVDRAVTQAILDAVTPACLDATADALETLRPRRAPRGFSASRSSAPPTRPSGHVAGTTPASRKTASSPARSPSKPALAELDTQQRAAQELERRRPAPLSDRERRALADLASDLPRVWQAPTTADRDRKQLLCCLLDDVVVTVDRVRRQARLDHFWQGGAHTEPDVTLNRTAAKRTDTSEDLVALIRRLAEHSPDTKLAMILAKQGHRAATGLTFTASAWPASANARTSPPRLQGGVEARQRTLAALSRPSARPGG